MRMAWDPTPFASGNPNATALAYYASWGARLLSLPGGAASTAAMEFASIWATYFLVPYVQAGTSDNQLTNLLYDSCSAAAEDVRASGAVSGKTAAAAAGASARVGGATTVAALAALQARAVALLAAVPPARQAYFRAHTLLQMSLHAELTSALASIAQATAASAGGDSAAAMTAASAAAASLDSVLAARRDGELPQWLGIYQYDHLSDVQRVRKSVRQFVGALASGKGAPLSPVPPYMWYTFEVSAALRGGWCRWGCVRLLVRDDALPACS
jgi:hypothetical protein